jgi:hypothetical protein
MLNVDLSMMLTALYVVTAGLFFMRLRTVEKRTAAYEKEIAKLRAPAQEQFQAERERMITEVRLEVQRAIGELRLDLEPDSSGHTLLTEMTQDDQKRIIVRFIENL